jgi:hypothetical protein
MSAAILSMLPKRKGRPAVNDGRQVLRLYPNGKEGRPFIYAIAFKGGVVKVGQTKWPRRRLLQHWKTGGGEVEWIHLFSSMHWETARCVENLAPSALEGMARQINGSEWFFMSASKADVIAVIRPLVEKAKGLVRDRWACTAVEKERARRVRDLLKEHGLLQYVDKV